MQSKPAVLAYPNSNNLGDFIQSIAATQWVQHQAPVSLDRDQLHVYQGDKVKLVMNGWFMEKPAHWPPSENIDPLFISFHLNPTAEKGMLTAAGVAYFKKHQPIGCRDLHTQKVLKEHGIETYFSACLTLSLQRKNFVDTAQKRKGVLVISPMERLLPQQEMEIKQGLRGFVLKGIQTIKQPFKNKKYKKAFAHLENYLKQIKEEVTYSTQLMNPDKHSEAERMSAALEQLQKIASVRLVITSRIHSALPAVAFGTPVLFLSDGLEHPNQKSRLEGMESFFRILKSEDLKNETIKIPKAKPIPKRILNRFKEELSEFLKE